MIVCYKKLDSPVKHQNIDTRSILLFRRASNIPVHKYDRTLHGKLISEIVDVEKHATEYFSAGVKKQQTILRK